MAIEISVLYSPDNVEVLPASHTFPEEGGTLGRSDNNFWVLQDPNKYMSSVHAKIECIAGLYYLTDMSTNGTFINGASEPVGKSNQIQLNDGDHFTISDYEFIASIPKGVLDDPFASPVSDDPFSDFDFMEGDLKSDSLDSLEPKSSDPFASGINQFAVTDSHLGNETIDPMAILNRAPTNETMPTGDAGIFDAPQPVSFSEPVAVNNENSYESQPVVTDSIDWPKAKPEVAAIPDDWDDWDSDPFPQSNSFTAVSMPQAAVKTSESVSATTQPKIPDDFSSADPFDDLLGQETTAQFDSNNVKSDPFAHLAMESNPNIEDPFSKNTFAKSEPIVPSSNVIEEISDVNAFGIADNIAPEPMNTASITTPSITSHSRVETNAKQSDNEITTLNLQNKQLQQKIAELTKQLQASQQHVVQLQTAATNQPTSSVNLSDNQAFNSVIDAMGLTKWNLQPNKVDDINKTVGTLMRETMKGMMRVLKFRKKIKEEFRINVTTIQSVENNPLKFSANIDDAMENMFIKENNAYKSPIDAVREGFESIAEHQVAVVAGMQAAFRGMIERFDPLHLENRFEKYNNASFLSLGQKTKRWSDYKAYHKELSENLDDSFQHLFGYDFVQAYEEQMQHLISARITENQQSSQKD